MWRAREVGTRREEIILEHSFQEAMPDLQAEILGFASHATVSRHGAGICADAEEGPFKSI